MNVVQCWQRVRLFVGRYVMVCLQQSQEAGEFLRCLGPYGLDDFQSLGGTLRVRLNDPAPAGRVEHHDGHGMRDDIVQFRCDLGALLRNGRFNVSSQL
ncbi:hypothetical protein OUO20_05420 [Arthrobacter sp. FX8]|nr:hypothetical protein [Arthrobacter sp. FX8]WAJ34375.1 hypothetical protein OUO20_05420 [Arthrobacter sp. FX8]